MTVDDAVRYGDFLHRSALRLSLQPRDRHGMLLRAEDRLEASDLYKLVEEHEARCRRMLNE